MSEPDESPVAPLEEIASSQAAPREPSPSSQPKKPTPLWRRFLREVILETLLPAWLVITFVAIPVGVRGESMNPTLNTGDYLIVLKTERWLSAWGIRPQYISRGDIIVTKAPPDNPASSEPLPQYLESLPVLGLVNWDFLRDLRFRPYLIKRVIGVPGDAVEVKAGIVYISGAKLTETYTTAARGVDDAPVTVVRPNTYFVMGDNRTRGSSLDSRAFGLVRGSDVAGRAVLRLWPLNKIGQP